MGRQQSNGVEFVPMTPEELRALLRRYLMDELARTRVAMELYPNGLSFATNFLRAWNRYPIEDREDAAADAVSKAFEKLERNVERVIQARNPVVYFLAIVRNCVRDELRNLRRRVRIEVRGGGGGEEKKGGPEPPFGSDDVAVWKRIRAALETHAEKGRFEVLDAWVLLEFAGARQIEHDVDPPPGRPSEENDGASTWKQMAQRRGVRVETVYRHRDCGLAAIWKQLGQSEEASVVADICRRVWKLRKNLNEVTCYREGEGGSTLGK